MTKFINVKTAKGNTTIAVKAIGFIADNYNWSGEFVSSNIYMDGLGKVVSTETAEELFNRLDAIKK